MKKLLAYLTIFSACLAAQPVSAEPTTSNTLTVNQWVQPTDAGVLNGRIVVPAADGASKAVEGAVVAIQGNSGKVLRSVGKTNSKGEFTIKGVKPGVYALSARADFVFAACAMHVLDSDLVGEQEFPKQAEISAANIDYTTVKTAIIRYLPPTAKQNKFSFEDVQFDALVDRVCAEDTFRVAQLRGGMKGRLHSAGAKGGALSDVQLTNVFIIKDGVEIARTTTNENGEFEIAKLGAGNYSLMAVGPDGLGLMGFELVDEDELVDGSVVTTADGKTLVTQIGGGCCCQELAMQVAPMPECMSVVEAPAPIVEQVVEPSCGCGQPAESCGCGVPVDPCGCGGEVIGEPIVEGEIIDGGYVDGGYVDGGYVDGGIGTPIAGGGFGGGGGFAGGGGFGGGGFAGGGLIGGGGGLGAIAGLAGVGGIIAATTSDDDNAVVIPAAPASPVVPN